MTTETKPVSTSDSKIIRTTFIDLGSNETVDVDVKETATLRHAWDEAYKKLTEKRKPTDELLCEKDGKSLMSFLDLTFEEMNRREICQKHIYKIRRETGGA
jgi:hypothetical protein